MQRRGFVFSCLSAVAGLFGVRGKPETEELRNPCVSDFGYDPFDSELRIMVHRSQMLHPYREFGDEWFALRYKRADFERLATEAIRLMEGYSIPNEDGSYGSGPAPCRIVAAFEICGTVYGRAIGFNPNDSPEDVLGRVEAAQHSMLAQMKLEMEGGIEQGSRRLGAVTEGEPGWNKVAFKV